MMGASNAIGLIDAAVVDLFTLVLLGAVIYWFRRNR
jgi:hypothetical protein